MRDDDRAADRQLQRHDSPLMSLPTRDNDRAADWYEQLWETPPPGGVTTPPEGVTSYMSEQQQKLELRLTQWNVPLMMVFQRMAFCAFCARAGFCVFCAWLTFRLWQRRCI